MIYSVFVTNVRGETLPLILNAPEKSGLVVRKIDGLGPPKATINMREKAGVSGSVFGSAFTTSRNIVFTLEFLESPTIEAARLRTYRFFPTESKIRMDFITETGTFYIFGHVETNEPTIFSREAGCVISVLCPDPFFDVANGKVSGTTEEIVREFEFPFVNEGATKGLNFGEVMFRNVEFSIPFLGSVNVAPKLIITAIGGEVVNPRIFFSSINEAGITESLAFEFSEYLPSLKDGDRLEIVCERQKKSVTRYVAVDGSRLNYTGAVSMDSKWPMLQPGDNLFSYEADSGASYIRFSYEYELKYVGI